MDLNAVYRDIDTLVSYAVFEKLIGDGDRWYAVNQILALLGIESYDGKMQPDPEISAKFSKERGNVLHTLLGRLCDAAVENGKIENLGPYREIFSTELMNVFALRPQQVSDRFFAEYKKGDQQAMIFLSEYMTKLNYLNSWRLEQDVRWSFDSRYGRLENLISLTKPEKDPQAILAAKLAPVTHYPYCALCRENEGYAGRINAPARSTHRLIPLTLNGEQWYLQLSPYKYMDQHCIVLTEKHIPMRINREKIAVMFEFLDMFPSLFLGSNSDLPFVGGSVLAHEHFQGGHHRLPIMNAGTREVIYRSADLTVDILNWPLSTIRITAKDRSDMVEQAGAIIERWHNYSDPSQNIDCGAGDDFHNTLTPLGWIDPEKGYVLCMMLRNNVTTPERPDGIYHTHSSRFHIKKEGIGIIDAPGLSILPPRLKKELQEIEKLLSENADKNEYPELSAHYEWIDELRQRYTFTKENAHEILEQEVGNIFVQMLEDCAVFDQTEAGSSAFRSFAESCIIF